MSSYGTDLLEDVFQPHHINSRHFLSISGAELILNSHNIISSGSTGNGLNSPQPQQLHSQSQQAQIQTVAAYSSQAPQQQTSTPASSHPTSSHPTSTSPVTTKGVHIMASASVTDDKSQSSPPSAPNHHNNHLEDSGDDSDRGTKRERSGSFDDGDPKKKRIKWAGDLHDRFLKAIEKLGDKAVPSAILNEMKVDGLSRENVASHLQKYRVQAREKLLNEYIKGTPPLPYVPGYGPLPPYGMPYHHDPHEDPYHDSPYHRRRSESEVYYQQQHYPHHRASMPALPAYGGHPGYYPAGGLSAGYPNHGDFHPSAPVGTGAHHYPPSTHYPRSASFSCGSSYDYEGQEPPEHPHAFPPASAPGGPSWRGFAAPSGVTPGRSASFSHPSSSPPTHPHQPQAQRPGVSPHPHSQPSSLDSYQDHNGEDNNKSASSQSSSAPSTSKDLFPDFPLLGGASRSAHVAPLPDYGATSGTSSSSNGVAGHHYHSGGHYCNDCTKTTE